MPTQGAFVYTGAGKKQRSDADICTRKCKKFACNIQYCLARNDHKEVRCGAVISAWKQCCEKVMKHEQEQEEKQQEQIRASRKA